MYKYKSLQAGQLSWEHLSSLKNPLGFIITKYVTRRWGWFKCLCWWTLPLWLLYNWRCKDLSMSHEKVMTLLPQWRSGPWISIKLFLLPKFDRDLSKSLDSEVMMLQPPEEEYPVEPSEWDLSAVQIWCF